MKYPEIQLRLHQLMILLRLLDESFLAQLFIPLLKVYQFSEPTVQTQHANALCQC